MKLNAIRNSVVLKEDICVPPIAKLLNVNAGIELLLYHLNNGGVIGIHFDVDLDGFSSGIVGYRSLKGLMPTVHITTNKEREHGPMPETAQFVWEKKISLLIIVDAGSDLTYDVGCDVLVLDHHDIAGVTEREINGHKQVIVSCMGLDTVEPMSGCEVVYEFFRHVYAQMETPIDTSLAQWVGVSLISDVIDTMTERNQFYVREAFEANTKLNADLRRICTDIDPYYRGLYRSYVTYKLAPYINGISRAGFSSSLAYVISDNEPPKLPAEAIERRDYICKEAIKRSKRLGNVVFSNMSEVDDAWRYSGLASAKISNETGCPTIVMCKEANGLVRGSFRKGVADGDFLEEAKKHINAKGHNSAFGFRDSTLEGIKSFLLVLSKWEKGVPVAQLTSNDIQGGQDLQVIAAWNNRVTSQDEFYIDVRPEELAYDRTTGKVTHYKWRGFAVKLLSLEFPQPPRLYVENQRGITIYLK